MTASLIFLKSQSSSTPLHCISQLDRCPLIKHAFDKCVKCFQVNTPENWTQFVLNQLFSSLELTSKWRQPHLQIMITKIFSMKVLRKQGNWNNCLTVYRESFDLKKAFWVLIISFSLSINAILANDVFFYFFKRIWILLLN